MAIRQSREKKRLKMTLPVDQATGFLLYLTFDTCIQSSRTPAEVKIRLSLVVASPIDAVSLEYIAAVAIFGRHQEHRDTVYCGAVHTGNQVRVAHLAVPEFTFWTIEVC